MSKNTPYADKVLGKATDATSISKKCLADAGTLFRAIQQLATSSPQTAEALAHIGNDLADDRFNIVDGIETDINHTEVK